MPSHLRPLQSERHLFDPGRKERAEELDAKIEQTDKLIDEYELYGLTDDEITIFDEPVEK
ncbi:hypothetical protein DVK07_13905 [Halorubrum sp. Atlit-26R]|nr:hypothetical protein DVK07_13905 [Halorubrum sp. Atlit-26R]